MVLSRAGDQIGRVLSGRYRLISPIGAGASALVFLADDTRLRRRVAVKLLHQALADDDAFLRRFRAEAQSAAALNHAHVLSVYDWGEDDHEPYLVTEFLSGGSLRGMLDQGRTLTTSQALVIGLEASRGLDYAHKRGFVHRDIKPANLLFGEEGRLRIADFGLARALAEAAWTEPAGAMVGTARYACPEQARGEKVDGKGDVYSLGLVLIEAVTGQVPFASDTTIATLMARVDKPVDVSPALGPLRRILERAGRPDPTERPDAGELAIGLLAAAEDLAKPEPLPLAGATTADGDALIATRDPTQLPPNRDVTTIEPASPGGSPIAPPGLPAQGPSARQARKAHKEQERAARKAALAAGTLHRRRWPWVALLAVLTLSLLGGSAFAYLKLRVASHAVPELVGLTEAQARVEAATNHWKVRKVETRQDDTTPGSVVTQDPPKATKLDEGKTVTITVSLGNTLVNVPGDLVDKSLEEATQGLAAAGLVVGDVKRQFDEHAAKDVVIAVDPLTPPQLAKGTGVNLVVSDGPAPRKVPAVGTGMTFDQFAAALTALQLKATRVDDFNDTVPSGQVIGTEPATGTEVPRDTAVTVHVSKGLTPIPNVAGLAIADARDKLQQAGFTVAGVNGDPFRTVRATNPPAGTQAPKGTGVTLITR
jgi:serine/threonine-protein kinase